VKLDQLEDRAACRERTPSRPRLNDIRREYVQCYRQEYTKPISKRNTDPVPLLCRALRPIREAAFRRLMAPTKLRCSSRTRTSHPETSIESGVVDGLSIFQRTAPNSRWDFFWRGWPRKAAAQNGTIMSKG